MKSTGRSSLEETPLIERFALFVTKVVERSLKLCCAAMLVLVIGHLFLSAEEFWANSPLGAFY